MDPLNRSISFPLYGSNLWVRSLFSRRGAVDYGTTFGNLRDSATGRQFSRSNAVSCIQPLGDLRGPRSNSHDEPLNREGFRTRLDDRLRPAASDTFVPPVSVAGRRGAVDFGRPMNPIFGPLHTQHIRESGSMSAGPDGLGGPRDTFFTSTGRSCMSMNPPERGCPADDHLAGHSVIPLAGPSCGLDTCPMRSHDEHLRTNPFGSAHLSYGEPHSAPARRFDPLDGKSL